MAVRLEFLSLTRCGVGPCLALHPLVLSRQLRPGQYEFHANLLSTQSPSLSGLAECAALLLLQLPRLCRPWPPLCFAVFSFQFANVFLTRLLYGKAACTSPTSSHPPHSHGWGQGQSLTACLPQCCPPQRTVGSFLRWRKGSSLPSLIHRGTLSYLPVCPRPGATDAAKLRVEAELVSLRSAVRMGWPSLGMTVSCWDFER
jgi:hypothetical protein